MIKLIGVLIVIVGFALKLDTLFVVLLSGITTGFVAGMSFVEILEVLGSSFVNTRYMTLFVLTLPVIGICERYGLKEKAVDLIRQAKGLTTGKILSLYLIIREGAAALSVRLGGHPQFVRPLIEPMAQGAAQANYGEVKEEDVEKIKGAAASMENFGNFFGQNVFMASSGVLLIVGSLAEQGYDVSAVDVAKASIPVALIALIVAIVKNHLFDKKLKAKYTGQKDNTK